MLQDITASDLEDWSRRLDARAHLPTLVRRLILASVNPEQIEIPDAEAIDKPGLDGVVVASTSTSPYVPVGRSAWEFGTSSDIARKVGGDYLKRTRTLSDDERSVTTIVVVTSRQWDNSVREAWVRRRATRDGWKGVVALTGEDLATWLPLCPGVSNWFETRIGRNPSGSTSLRDWWHEWSSQTVPPIPERVLIAGRSSQATGLVDSLRSAPAEHVVATRTEDEAIAFTAAALLAPPIADTDNEADEPDAEANAAAAARAERSRREAVLERTLVVDDTATWRARILDHQGLVLIPTGRCVDPPLDEAVNRGHHVVLPRTAGPSDIALSALDRGEAGDAWRAAGQDFDKSDELARAARRSLTSLRRRYGRAGRMRLPEWATGQTATILGPLLLLNGWNLSFEGDARLVLEMTDRQSARGVSRELGILASTEDPPILHRGDVWEFADPVDAWDALSGAITSEDLDLLNRNVQHVLCYQNPTRLLGTAERLAASVTGTLPAPLYSGALRRGMASTLSLLGSILGDKLLPGGVTGAECSATAVYELLNGATNERWLDVADLLPMLAEAAPSVFMRILEEQLRDDDPAVLSLFNEREGDLGLGSSSSHSSLLWALEALAFSPALVSRVAVVLGQLAELDPGGKLANRPKNSLRSVLHPVVPQGAVDTSARLGAIDAVRKASPDASFDLLMGLLGSLRDGMVLHHRARFHDWARPRPPTQTDVQDTISGIATRLVADARLKPGRWSRAIAHATKIPEAQRTAMLNALTTDWPTLPSEEQLEIASIVRKDVARHKKYRNSAWAIDDAGLAELQAFVDGCAPEAPLAPHQLFTWFPDLFEDVDRHSDEAMDRVRAARRDAVDRLGLDGLATLAARADLPTLVGDAAADAGFVDGHLLVEWLTRPESHLRDVAAGYARARQAQDGEWMPNACRALAHLHVQLLLTTSIDDAVIAEVDDLTEAQRIAFWSEASEYWVVDSSRRAAAERLIAVDRPFAAISVLFREEESSFPADLNLAALRAIMGGSTEEPSDPTMVTYLLHGTLDRLESAGVADEDLAPIEWFLHPILQHERRTSAYHRLLARDPERFAALVAITSSPDDPEAEPEEQPDNIEAVRENAFWILREWSVPLPGMVGTEPPSAGAVHEWVAAARASLEDRGRGKVGAEAIGTALSGPVHDPDGTWPCEAVRSVLQRENDSDIESGLFVGRMNSRGVTTRGIYDGGVQERTLASQYRGWADRVRDEWPRAGAVLDDLASSFDGQGRREDRSADAYGDR